MLDGCPVNDPPTDDDAYVHAEAVRLLMKQKAYKDPRLKRHMIGHGKNGGWSVLESEVKTLNDLYKFSKLLKEVYAGVKGIDHITKLKPQDC